MQRRREGEMGSEIRSAIAELSTVVHKVKPPAGATAADAVAEQHKTDSIAAAYIPVKPFLSVCSLVLQVLGLVLIIFCLYFVQMIIKAYLRNMINYLCMHSFIELAFFFSASFINPLMLSELILG